MSRTLEFAYDDYVLSSLADLMGHTEDAQMFLSRSENYRNVIDAEGVCVGGGGRGGEWGGVWIGVMRESWPLLFGGHQLNMCDDR